MKNSTSSKRKNWKMTVLSIIFLLIIWQFLATYINSPLIIPFPKTVFIEGLNLLSQKRFLIAFLNTTKRCIIAFLISLSIGLSFGIASTFNERFKYFIDFPLELIRSVPVISVIMLALFWLKSDGVPIFSAVLMTLPVMTTCVQAGFSVCNKEILYMAKVYGFTGMQKFLFVRIPSAYPSIASGIKSTSGMAWKVVAAGEVLSLPRNALGSYLQNAQAVLETQQVFAVTAIIVFSSFLCTLFIKIIIKISGFAGKHFVNFYLNRQSSYCKDKTIRILPEAREIIIKDLNLGYNELIYKDFSLYINKAETLGILAPSGFGKTTLLNYIAETNDNVSYIFQEPRLLNNLTAMQNILLPLTNIMNKEDAMACAKNYLQKTGLQDKASSFPSSLSGGEKQRLSLARAFAYPSGILLMDEPFQSQDYKTKTQLTELLKSLQKENPRTTVLVTHDPSEAKSLAQRIIQLEGRPAQIMQSQ